MIIEDVMATRRGLIVKKGSHSGMVIGSLSNSSGKHRESQMDSDAFLELPPEVEREGTVFCCFRFGGSSHGNYSGLSSEEVSGLEDSLIKK